MIVDEAYLEFADHFAQRTLTDLVRAGENVIVFRTFAKVYGLAGLDIGYGLVPVPIAKALSAQGLNNPHLFNRLAVAAAAASLKDADYVGRVTALVAGEREQWFELFRDLKLNFTPSSGNFVFFETGMPHAEFAAAMLKDGVAIGHAFPPYDRWASISIGLPEENTRPARTQPCANYWRRLLRFEDKHLCRRPAELRHAHEQPIEIGGEQRGPGHHRRIDGLERAVAVVRLTFEGKDFSDAGRGVDPAPRCIVEHRIDPTADRQLVQLFSRLTYRSTRMLPRTSPSLHPTYSRWCACIERKGLVPAAHRQRPGCDHGALVESRRWRWCSPPEG